mgnify:CR=1 FL=1
MKKQYYFKGMITVTNTDIKEEFSITHDIDPAKLLDEEYGVYEASNEMGLQVVSYAIDFANEFGFTIPYDYVSDDMDSFFENGKECNYVYVNFVDSDLLTEDNFDVIWDNYMKAFGRGRL